ncbi:MAG: hypothetical protein NZM35_09070, partial [Chitinophagales bacterium]|nr:hypothetical protein [Chitinophagales bacterium]
MGILLTLHRKSAPAMLNLLRQIDLQIFHTIHFACANPAGDVIFPILREKLTWLPLYLILLFWSFRTFGRNALWIIFFAVAAVIISDQLAAHVIKPLVHRLRPCRHPELKNQVRMLVTCGSGYSFVSAHAAN